MWQMTPVTGGNCGRRRSALAARRPVAQLDTRGRSCRSACSSLRAYSFCTASSARKSHQAIWRRSSPGSTIAVCSSSRCWRRATSSARDVPSCSFATWGRHVHPPARLWPKRLRGKWLAIVLFVGGALLLRALRSVGTATGDGVSWSSRTSPRRWRLTSFSKARASASTSVRLASSISSRRRCRRSSSRFDERSTCQSCRTSDCIAGRRAPEAPAGFVQRGCELGLYLPAKVGNIDCTFCLDCVHACPHDNIAISVRTPGLELADARRRSGIGRLINRPDIAVLAVLFVFGALLNAFAMVSPAYSVEAVVGPGTWQQI